MKAISETDLVRGLLETLRALLPKGWTVQEPEREVLWAGSSGGLPVNSKEVDAVLTIGAPSGEESRIVIEVKKKLDPRDVPTAIAQLRRELNEPLLIVCPYVGPTTDQRLVPEGVGYADVTGSLRASLERPALSIQQTGAVVGSW